MGDAVREQGGVVQGFTGDGIMAVFGAPTAFEDAPLRACRTAWQSLTAKDGGRRPRSQTWRATAIAHRPQHWAGGVGTGRGWYRRSGYGPRRHGELRGAPTIPGRAGFGMHERGDAQTRARHGRRHFRGRTRHQGQIASRRRSIGSMPFARGDPVRSSDKPGAQRLCWARTRTGGAGSRSHRGELPTPCRRSRCRAGHGKVAPSPRVPVTHRQERAFVLSGSCSPDGQQTAFLPFIEVVRGSFRVNAGETEKDVAQKLETGLTALGLHSQ